MEISEDLLCLFSAEVEQRNGSYVIEVPEQELTLGDIDANTAYRVALLPTATPSETEGTSRQGPTSPKPSVSDQTSDHYQEESGPPVEEGEQRTVEIEDIGEQGDGIARVERGYVIIVPDTEVGERVKIEITEVKSNFAVAEVVEESP